MVENVDSKLKRSKMVEHAKKYQVIQIRILNALILFGYPCCLKVSMLPLSVNHLISRGGGIGKQFASHF